MNTKVCKQCGVLKPLEQFRKYYGGRKGSYNTCKLCEKINARAKYLERKETLSPAESDELTKIHRLYDAQRAVGLKPPREDRCNEKSLSENIDDMIAMYEHKAEAVNQAISSSPPQHVPAELAVWLTCELTEDPDYYIDDVYEELKDKYRPKLSIDTATLQPIYDDTYKSVLEDLLNRFYEYEQNYYANGGE